MRPVQSQGSLFATLLEVFGRPCSTNSNAERCNGLGYTMRIGSNGTIDCSETCSFLPVFRSASGYACGSCGPIPSRAPSAPVVAPPSTSAPVGVPPESSFDITLDLVGETSKLSVSDRLAFRNAAGRFESVITTGISDIPKSFLNNPPPYDGCAYPTVIDDVYICVNVLKADGAGKVLASASPTYQRSSDGSTVAGFVNIYDVENLIRAGAFEDVLAHEIGHILGIGTYFVGTFSFSSIYSAIRVH